MRFPYCLKRDRKYPNRGTLLIYRGWTKRPKRTIQLEYQIKADWARLPSSARASE